MVIQCSSLSEVSIQIKSISELVFINDVQISMMHRVFLAVYFNILFLDKAYTFLSVFLLFLSVCITTEEKWMQLFFFSDSKNYHRLTKIILLYIIYLHFTFLDCPFSSKWDSGWYTIKHWKIKVHKNENIKS